MANERPASGNLDDIKLAELTAQVVSAYVSNNALPASELAGMIRAVSASLQTEKPAEAPAAAMPAVSVRRSVAQDHLTCLVCGKKQKTLKRHLASAHGMSPAEYRERFGLSREYPMVAPAYSTARSAMAKQLGLGRKPGEERGGRGGRRGGRRRGAGGAEQSAA